MFSKKTRNLTVAVLALIMALTLSFGLFGFNTTQQVNAEVVWKAYDGTTGTLNGTTSVEGASFVIGSGVTRYNSFNKSYDSTTYKNCLRIGGTQKTDNDRDFILTIPANYTANIYMLGMGYSSARKVGLSTAQADTKFANLVTGTNTVSWTSSNIGEYTANGIPAGTYYIVGDAKFQICLLTVTLIPQVDENAPTVTEILGYTATVKSNEVSLPKTLKGYLSDDTEKKNQVDINVEWDKDLVTTAPSTTTYTATAVAGTTYRVVGTVTAQVTLTLRPGYDTLYSANAYWNIKEVTDGEGWLDKYTDRVIINNVNGITVKASDAAYVDVKSNSVDNCIKADKGKDFFTVTVPAKFDGKLIVLASAYSNSKSASLSLDGGEAQPAKLTTGTNVDTLATDDNIIGAQAEVKFDIKNTDSKAKSYVLSNKGENGYISSIKVEGTAVDTSTPSAKHYFFAGEKLGTMNVDGYQFLGWTNADGTKLYKDTATEEATADVAGDYYAVLAKAEYMGVSFRLDKVGVRYGFGINFYDLNDAEKATNSLKSTVVNNILKQYLTKVTFNATINNTEYPYSYTKETLKYTYDEETNKFVSNLVFVNFSNPTTQFGSTVKVDATFTINNVVLSPNGTASKINDKLADAKNDKFGIKDGDPYKYEDVAAMYGLTA